MAALQPALSWGFVHLQVSTTCSTQLSASVRIRLAMQEDSMVARLSVLGAFLRGLHLTNSLLKNVDDAPTGCTGKLPGTCNPGVCREQTCCGSFSVAG